MKQVKTSSAESVSEAVDSLQSLLKQREDELQSLRSELGQLRHRTRAEQKLILSAWYDLGMQLQRRQTQQHSASSPSTPSSWLGQQRKNILETPVKSRR